MWACGSILTKTSVGTWRRVERLMRPILFWWCRSEKEDSDDSGGEMIEAILKVCEARGKVAESLTSAWKLRWWWFWQLCVDRWYFLCLNWRSDVEDPRKAVILVAVIDLLAVKIQPWHLWRWWSNQEKAQKRFTDRRSRGSGKYQQR